MTNLTITEAIKIVESKGYTVEKATRNYIVKVLDDRKRPITVTPYNEKDLIELAEHLKPFNI